MKALITLLGAVAGVLLLVVASMIQPALPWPGSGGVALIDCPLSAQLPALLLTALVCGPRVGLITAVAYLTLGLARLPVFSGGGGMDYLVTPDFGFLVGFVPASWLVGRLAQQEGMEDPFNLWCACAGGILVVQTCGGLNLLVGALAGRWQDRALQLWLSYGLLPLPWQLLMACLPAVLALLLRRLLPIR
ncbi:MAG: biotin transporter BioY [Aphanocapsa feldmannii 277cV]|uniref:Biotin transporter n=2 Tax=Aphanocapsa feldmannii TaxID=192050 RepID=A0A524RL85_9CHRO|nr:MAG: biotin transporter BioY [Aphanocapsa feldmannii 288cV]TGG90830.1 MAG: biotin transporter BioY [Aphanocapsa feldmannii 277cV]TGH22943.1 MAG: biotin transporter BioY [Aphanocapsa feldmannii 277cI]